MADLFKVTWFCQYGRGGFSFSHWKMGTDYSAVLASSKQLGNLYLGLCGNDVEMNYIRASRQDIRGDSQVVTDTNVTGQGGTSGQNTNRTVQNIVGNTPDAWWTAALVRLGASPSVFGRQFIRGIPDDVVILPGGITSNAAWRAALAAYFGKLVSDAWGMYAVPRGVGYQKNITGITKDAVSHVYTITTDAVHGITTGQPFRISGFVGAAGTVVNGVWNAESIPSTTTITVGPSQAFDYSGQVKKWGQLWTQAKAFAPYIAAQCQLLRITERRAGRPFDSLVGRRKRRK